MLLHAFSLSSEEKKKLTDSLASRCFCDYFRAFAGRAKHREDEISRDTTLLPFISYEF